MAKFEDFPAMPPRDPARRGTGPGRSDGRQAPVRRLRRQGRRPGAACRPCNPAAPQHPDTLSGPGDDAALLRHGPQVQAITTDHLRTFTHDPALMARLAALHALGDIWAMGAAPQAALAQITLPRLSDTLQSRTWPRSSTPPPTFSAPPGPMSSAAIPQQGTS